MASTIPYDPSLALANIVPAKKLAVLEAIAKVQAPVDGAQHELNSAILTLRSLDMTMSEVANMGVDITPLVESRTGAQKLVGDAAAKLVAARIKALPQVAKLRSDLEAVTDSIESPVDYVKTEIKKMPLSADSLTMDAQYFSFDENDESASTQMAAIKAYVSAATKVLGTSRSAEATAAVSGQVSTSRQHHDIEGTLIITATCTHKDAVLLAPFVLDVDKAIRVWNRSFGGSDMIKTNDAATMAKIAAEQETEAAKTLTILSGATYGSSFIGMVHVLRSSETQSSQRMMSVAASLQAQMKVGSWWASQEGGFGVNSSFANDAKLLLSTQQISSHVSLVVIGAIPSIKSNSVKVGVKEFADFDAAKMGQQLASLQNATATDQESVQQGATAARTGQQMLSLQSSKIQSVLTGLADIDDGQDKMLDISSLMTAFEDYIEKVLAGNAGAPITYYMKPITASQLAQMWIAKYLPGQYVTSAGDDTTPVQPGGGGQPQPS